MNFPMAKKVDAFFARFPWLSRYIQNASHAQIYETWIDDALLEMAPRKIRFEFVEFTENIFLLDEDGNILKHEFSEDFRWWKPKTWSGRRTIYGKVGRRSTIRECIANLKEEGEKIAFILSDCMNIVVIYKALEKL